MKGLVLELVIMLYTYQVSYFISILSLIRPAPGTSAARSDPAGHRALRILRTRWLSLSAVEAMQVPAKVVTLPPGSILRMQWFSLSETKRLPAASLTRLLGPLKRAATPWALTRPAGALPLPAMVVTLPPGSILRTVWFEIS